MIFLRPLSWIFLLIVTLRNRFYDWGILKSIKLPGVVISVGNIAVGGTGKSPVVIDIARRVIAAGGRPVIVTRGYRSGLSASDWQVLQDGRIVFGFGQGQVGADEARMQSLALPGVPVVIGARRVKAVRNFLALAPKSAFTHFILDDGFQHRKIKRDQDIVVVDVRDPVGALLPSGRFREPMKALRRAHDVVLTKAKDDIQLQRCRLMIQAAAPQIRQFDLRLVAQPVRMVCGVEGQKPNRWAAVAGIAKPEDFIASLATLGINPVVRFFSGDHQSFNPYLLQSARANFDGIVTTEKDWARDEVRFIALAVPVYILPLKPVWGAHEPRIYEMRAM
jgi:tetraacyldisaccharide 4'-kinase